MYLSHTCVRDQRVIGWSNLRGIFRKFSIFPPSAFSTTRETSHLSATARSVGGSMTLNLVIVSLWVTLRIATFRAERQRSMPEEERVVSGRGAFPTRKLLWVIPRSMHGNPREVQRVRFFLANYAIQRQSSGDGGDRFQQIASRLSSEIAQSFCAIPWIVYLSPR